jgi:hypothetical protein
MCFRQIWAGNPPHHPAFWRGSLPKIRTLPEKVKNFPDAPEIPNVSHGGRTLPDSKRTSLQDGFGVAFAVLWTKSTT